MNYQTHKDRVNIEADEYEGEVEYERLKAAITPKAAEKFISERHNDQFMWYGLPRQAHLELVAKSAKDYANFFYRDASFFEQDYSTRTCYLAGLLHESMDAGANYEDIIDASDEATAKYVAALTADWRTPAPKRIKIFVNQVGTSSPQVQLVKLADLVEDVTCLKEMFKKRQSTELKEKVRRWIDDARDLSHVLFKVRESIFLSQPFEFLKTTLIELETKCRRKR